MLLCLGCGSPEPAPVAPVAEISEAPAPECEAPHDCALVPRACCPPCGTLDLDDVIASPHDAPEPDHCGRLECSGCPSTNDPSLFATCEAGRCVAVDLRQDALSACSADGDCAVVVPDCCACRPGHVAIRADSESEYYRRQCGEIPICSPCERHDIPASLVGRCVESHCAVAERAPEPPPLCSPECGPVDQDRCQPDGAPCTCGYLHQPFADCVPRADRPCPSARAFTVACDPRCCP